MLVVAVLLLMPAALAAHQWMRASAPADGATLSVVPDTLRLEFNEAVRIRFTEVTMEGEECALTLGELRLDPTDPKVLLIPVAGGWHGGEITVAWVTVGSDGHRTDGRFTFTVEEDAEGLPAEPDPEEAPVPDEDTFAAPAETGPSRAAPLSLTSPVFVAFRWLWYGSMVVLGGAVTFPLMVLGGVLRRRLREGEAVRERIVSGSAALGAAAATLLLVSGIGRLWAQSAVLTGAGDAATPDALAAALSLQPWATSWVLHITGAVLALTGFLWLRRTGGHGFGWAAAVAGFLVAAASPALTGHSAAAEWEALTISASALHVIGAGGWVGSLLVLISVAVPAALELAPERRTRTLAALVEAFSPAALLFSGVIVASGVVMAAANLRSLSDLWASAYGQALLAKLALFLVVLALGAYNFLRIRPRMYSQLPVGRLRRAGGGELGVAALILLLTAVLVALPLPSV